MGGTTAMRITVAAAVLAARADGLTSLGAGPLAGLRAPGAPPRNWTLGAAARSTSDCGTTSGQVSSLSLTQYTQVGCANADYDSMSVSLSLSLTSNDYVGVCVASGSACVEPFGESTACIFRGYTDASSLLWKLAKSCGQTSTCCALLDCQNSILPCSPFSYTSTFTGVYKPGIIAGIVLGSLVALALVCWCVRAGCARRRARYLREPDVVAYAAAPYQPAGYQQQAHAGGYQQQSYAGPSQALPAGYQHGGYGQAPPFQPAFAYQPPPPPPQQQQQPQPVYWK